MRIKLTIGMATYDDLQVPATCQALALYHSLQDCEIIIVDNNPTSKAGKETAAFANACSQRKAGSVRYIAMPEATGTTQPRQRIFEEARGDAVLVIDPHIMIAAGAIQRLIQYYDEYPDCLDLLSGPLLYDNLEQIETHFAPIWGIYPDPDTGKLKYSGMLGQWATDPRGLDPDNPPFPVWGQGLGLFSCRRSAWLGFNPHFRGFGGEEGYIHEKFRLAGRQCLCLPFLRWWHNFGSRPEGVPYPNLYSDRVRNYILGFQELGLSVDPVREHFVGGKLITPATWDYLLEDPINHRGSAAANRLDITEPPELQFNSLEAVADHYAKIPRDLDQHAARLKEIAAGKRILLFGKRIAWDVFLLAGGPGTRLKSYNTELDPLRETLQKLAEKESILYGPRRVDSLYDDPSDTGDYDLVILDTIHAAERTAAELAKFHEHTQRFLIRSTAVFGQQAEGVNEPGMFYAIRAFLAEHPEWFVAEHSDVQYGYTILSRVSGERPALPIWPWPPGFGPGTELGKLLASIGVTDKPSCDCTAKRHQMDRWGVPGCREHREQIIQWMQEGSVRWGYADKLKAAALAVTTGLAGKVNWLNPFPDLIDLAIANAEEVTV